MPKVSVNDINLYFEVHGTGFPIIVISGLAENIYWWSEEFVKEVSGHYQLILFDNRGAGHSDKPDIEYSIEMMAKDTIGLMDQLKIDEAFILGHSLGGLIAQEIALSYPKRVKKLILCSTSCPEKSVSANENILNLLSERGTAEQIVRKVTIPVNFSNDFVKNNPNKIENIIKKHLIAPIPGRAFRRQLQASRNFRSCERLKTLEIPTLILHGQQDILVPTENGNILNNIIPNSKLRIFEKSAHILFTQDPELEIEVLLDFLDQN